MLFGMLKFFVALGKVMLKEVDVVVFVKSNSNEGQVSCTFQKSASFCVVLYISFI